MPSRLTEVIVDCQDLDVMASFWCQALGYVRTATGEGWLSIGPEGQAPSFDDATAGPLAPHLSFVIVLEAKATKNRLHIDVTPVGVSRDDEVERLLALGAAAVDIGQGDTRWVVLADPEGNEFCVMPEWVDD